jgi:hypothetical protein
MEEIREDETSTPKENKEESLQFPLPRRPKRALPEVVMVRNWKEYLGESLLIILSVVLALILTEIFNKIRDDRQTREVLHQLRQELIDNKKHETEQYHYHLQVLKNIDSALRHPEFAKRFISNGEINLEGTVAPLGVISNDLNNVAWEVAKQKDVFAKLGFTTYSLLTDIYNNQQRITSSEDKIGALLLSWESRKPENLKTTLILFHDNYIAWDVERAPRLLDMYQQAIEKLSGY